MRNMKCDSNTMRLYAVTDRAWVGRQTLLQQVESALKGGATCIQLREKALSEQAFFQEALEIKTVCKRYGVPFLINDNIDVAIQCGADGVHVGQGDRKPQEARRLIGPDKILGVSAQTVEQAVEAERSGADYLGVGAVFTTTTKLDAKPVSYETLKEICHTVTIPVVAIGGISKRNLFQLSGAGVDGVALVSAIFSAQDIEAECRELRALSQKMVEG